MLALTNAIIVFVLYGLNIGAMPSFSILGAIPNFLLIYFLVYAFETKFFYSSLFVLLVSGLLLDYSSEVYFGSFLFAMFFSLFILRFFTSKLFILERNFKNTYVIFGIFYFFSYLFVFVYNYYALKFGYRHLSVVPEYQSLWFHYFIEFCYSLPFVYLFRQLVCWQSEFLGKNFYANTKKFL